MNYIALIGDIIDSKKIADRGQAQQKLLALMKELNQKYQQWLVSPFTVTTGDEFQALLKPNTQLFQMIDDLVLAFAPHQIRFGIGLGKMLTDINPKQSIGSDGPAYWRAREAINRIHAKNDYGSNHLAVSLENEESSQLINSILAACSFIKGKWTPSQLEILQCLLAQGIYDEGFSNKKIAELLGVSPSALNKRIKASGLKIYLRNKRQAMDLILKEAEREDDHVS
ncbi:SatD family protein [Streptococcus massiliensis]|uniref:Putative satD protein n=1 Tax=Streptococcus massiliensis TaxID=313439 RepID=A0A380KXH8_9STRE|nr:SatD family protein [Streptococcus massiliensis]SUN75817.1 putative satD protein [Streptococcus massiliensis]